MTWARLDPRIRDLATSALTPKQLAVWKLHLAGCSQQRIADMLLISRRSVRTHLDTAHLRLRQAGITMPAHRTYHLEEAA